MTALVLYSCIDMEKVLKVSSSFEEAEQADDEYYASLTPQQRVDLLLDLIAAHRESLGETASRFERFIELLNSRKVDYIVVGGHAVAFHGHPRFTGDIDFLLRPSDENAERLIEAVKEFGFSEMRLAPDDFTRPNTVVQLGYPPNRVDLLTSISGVDFEEAWSSRAGGELDGLPVYFLGWDALLKNKRASGRDKDLADVSKLLAIKASTKRP